VGDTDRWILAIDQGNSGPKVAAVSLTGQLLGTGTKPVSVQIGSDGSATQDPEEWRTALRTAVAAAIADAKARIPLSPSDLHSVAVTGQWGSTVPVDENGAAVGPVLLWADTRAAKYSSQLVGGKLAVDGIAPHKVLPWLRYTGGAPSPHGADPTGHVQLLRNELADIGRRARWLLEPVDYLTMMLTGRPAATPASMILSWITDNRPGATPRYLPELVHRTGRDPRQLPELLPTGSIQGTLQPDIAAEWGLQPGAPVTTGIPDLHAAALGSGATSPFDTHLAVSTTAWLSAPVPFKKTDVFHQMATVPGLTPDLALIANNIETGGAALTWLRERIIAPHDLLSGGGSGIGADGAAPPLAHPTFDDLFALAEHAEPGSEGVIFTPWLNGERSPIDDRDLRAAWVNLTLRTNRAALVRSVLEGVALNITWLFEYYQRFLKRPVPSVRILGGGARSDLWCGIIASCLNRPVQRVTDPLNAQLRGAALWSRVSLGEISLAEAADLIELDQTFQPDPAAMAIYREHYREFRSLAKSLRGFYHRMNG
jgi:xylulokinase